MKSVANESQPINGDTSKPARAPLPWRTLAADEEHPDYVNAVVLDAGGRLVGDCNIFGAGGRSEEERHANAAVIVAAVNAHADLLALAQFAYCAGAAPELNNVAQLMLILDQLRKLAGAALAKAGVGTEGAAEAVRRMKLGDPEDREI